MVDDTLEQMSSAAIAGKVRRRFSPREYLLLERQADSKSEYYEGEIFAMAGATPEHNFITANVIAVLAPLLRKIGCRVLASDQRIAAPSGNYFYADVSAVCGEARFSDRQKDTLTNPALIVEVLSKSTQQFDRRVKLAEYQQMPSVREISLVSQERLRVEHYSRQPRKQWTIHTASKLSGVIEIASLSASLPIAEIYAGLRFD